jgi:hypothetical protein
MGFAICNDLKDFSFFFFMILFSLGITRRKLNCLFFLKHKRWRRKTFMYNEFKGILFFKSHKNKSPYMLYKKSTLQEWKVTMRNMPSSNFSKTILWSLNGKAQKNGEVMSSCLLSLVKNHMYPLSSNTWPIVFNIFGVDLGHFFNV